MGRKTIITLIIALTILFSSSMIISGNINEERTISESHYRINSNPQDFGDQFSLLLTDENGNDLSDPIFGKVIVYFDSFDSQYGTIYKLKAMISIQKIPGYVTIKSDIDGLFKLSTSAVNMDSFLTETGMRITITSDDDIYHADLRSSNNYSADYKADTDTIASLEPNVKYHVSVSLLDEYESSVAPENVENITITFQATIADGFHQVAFISEGSTIESYMAPDGYVIEHVPEISRSGYSFKGWFTPDRKEVTDGYTISSNEGDIFAYAEWEPNSEDFPIAIAIVGGIITALVVASIIILALKKKKNGATE